MVRKWFVSLFPVWMICSVHSSSVIKVKDTTSKGRRWLKFHTEQSEMTYNSLNSSCSSPVSSVQGVLCISKEHPSLLAISKLSCASTSSRKPSLASTPSLPIGLSSLSFPSPSLSWLLPVVLQLTHYSTSGIRVWNLWRPRVCCFSRPHFISYR